MYCTGAARPRCYPHEWLGACWQTLRCSVCISVMHLSALQPRTQVETQQLTYIVTVMELQLSLEVRDVAPDTVLGNPLQNTLKYG